MSGSGIGWAVCKSAPHSREITMPAPHHSVFTGRMPFLLPNQQRQSTEGKRCHYQDEENLGLHHFCFFLSHTAATTITCIVWCYKLKFYCHQPLTNTDNTKRHLSLVGTLGTDRSETELLLLIYFLLALKSHKSE